MVDCVKAPEKWHFVQSQMNEIFRNVRNHDGQEKLHNPGHASDQFKKDRNAQKFGGLGGGQQHEKRQNLDWEMSGHEIDHVLNPIFSECSLFRILRPDSFEWH